MIRIVIEDKDFLIVEKPAGISTQPLTRHLLPATSDSLSREGRGVKTLAESLAAKYPELRAVGGSDWGAVHRLDRDTSGLVIFARNEETYLRFREMFSKNKIEREYVALVEGEVTEGGKIDWPIGPDPKSPKRVKVYKNRKDAIRHKAQEAVTIYTPLPPAGEGQGVRVLIKTGRRHQIRAHLAAIGHPVLRLHASRLRFRHPRDPKAGRWVEAFSPVPFSGSPPEAHGIPPSAGQNPPAHRPRRPG